MDTSLTAAGGGPAVTAEEVLRRRRRQDPDTAPLWEILDQVCDPEIPVLSIWDLGVLRDIERTGEHITVTITPTYSGCPAMTTITEDVEAALARAGFAEVSVKLTLAPAWTTDWISAAGREKMRAYGIAPPVQRSHTVACPQCGSDDTGLISEFGSTACKALYRCNQCLEPFDYFKCL
ncbi:1,2-phenylacetyl-CoA epoxidase subunit PaaD [Exilibacterium tricleocarpae]|uniref:1,2-phenylacetyl-CoA epoxidase subunit PaaD n=1 Tax=Exilibacterium tricleocarpae TaxID=2591008 RepID=UPI001FE30C06|nr:1,2-phenylacetyl-CoA epoxidase subunit PaaD [Exilibacterium tricleocarpae]